MYKFHIDNMVNNVLDSLNNAFPKGLALTEIEKIALAGAIRAGIEKEWEDKIAVTWCVEDIHSLVWDFHGRKISNKDALEILNNIFNHLDASQGINWDVIESWIDSYFDDKEV